VNLSDDVRVEEANATQNFDDGIVIHRGIVRRCNASQNRNAGIG